MSEEPRMEVTTTENVFREWDESGKLLREISTLTQTRTPVAPVKPRFGFELPPERPHDG